MFRDFSDEGKNALQEYIGDVIKPQNWEELLEMAVDLAMVSGSWLVQLGLKNSIDGIGEYQTALLEKHVVTSQRIEEIFSDVRAVDKQYSGILAEAVDTAEQLTTYINNLAGCIEPSGGNFTVANLAGVMEIAKENLESNQIELTGALGVAEQEEIGEAYIVEAAGLNLTYEDFMKLTEAQQQEYIKRAGAYMLALCPTVSVEGKCYEQTVPIGVDMTATYRVTIKGSMDGDNGEVVNLTIEQQQLVLKSVGWSGDGSSVTVDEQGVGLNVSNQNYTLGMMQQYDGQVELKSIITNGESKMIFSVGGNITHTNIKYEIETTISEDASVSSEIEINQSNNTNMPQWEPVPELSYAPVMQEDNLPDLGDMWHSSSNPVYWNGYEPYSDYSFGVPLNPGVVGAFTVEEILILLLLLLVPVP